MKLKATYFIISLFVAVSAYSQTEDNWAKINSLFAEGTASYTNEAYDDALISFIQCRNSENGIFGYISGKLPTLEKIGDCYNALGYYDEALLSYKEALSICEKTSGKRSAEYARILNNMAVININGQKYPEALRLGNKVLCIYEEVYGKGCAESADVLNNIIDCNIKLGNNVDSSGAVLLEIYEKTKGKVSYEYITLLSKLAECQFSVCDYDEAISMETEALELRENMYGKVDGSYINSLITLSYYNSKAGNFDEATKLLQEASKLKKQGVKEGLWPE